MADFSSLKQTIKSYIKQNGNEEITGNILQDVLLAMISTLGDSAINGLVSTLQDETTARQNQDATLQGNITAEATARQQADTALGGRIDGLQTAINGINTKLAEGYIYAGIATPSTNPGTPSGKVFYIAVSSGTYTNFSNLTAAQGINILKYDGSLWSKDVVYAIDARPKKNSQNPVTSGGVFDNMGALDVSELNATENLHTPAIYADLSAALAAIPTDYQKGGMSVKFIQSSDNKYVQYRLMSETFNTTVNNWQGVDDEPTEGSDNLVKSGGVAKHSAFDNSSKMGVPFVFGSSCLRDAVIYKNHIVNYSGTKHLIMGITQMDPSLLMNCLAIPIKEGTTYSFIILKQHSEFNWCTINSELVFEHDVSCCGRCRNSSNFQDINNCQINSDLFVCTFTAPYDGYFCCNIDLRPRYSSAWAKEDFDFWEGQADERPESYIFSIPRTIFQKVVNASNIWENLNIVVLGDSITWLGGDDCNGRQNPSRGWTTYFKSKVLPQSIASYARSGATWSHTANTQYDITEDTGSLSDDNVIFNQINRLIAAVNGGTQVPPDLIIIAAGTNDAWYPSRRPDALSVDAETEFANTDGYITSQAVNTLTSIAAAMRYDIELLKTNFPNCQIIVTTPLQATSFTLTRCFDVGKIIRDCAKYLSVECIDQGADAGVYRAQENTTFIFTYDGTHTSALGAKMVGQFIAKKVMYIYRDKIA